MRTLNKRYITPTYVRHAATDTMALNGQEPALVSSTMKNGRVKNVFSVAITGLWNLALEKLYHSS